MDPREPQDPTGSVAARPADDVVAWATPVDGGRLQVLLDALPWQFAPPEPGDAPSFEWRAAAAQYAGPRAGIGPTVTLARMGCHPRSQGRIGLLPHDGRDFRLVYLLQWSGVPVACVSSSDLAPRSSRILAPLVVSGCAIQGE